MNYRHIYMRIIVHAKKEQLEGKRPSKILERKKFPNQYFEFHHIFPKSLFPQYKDFKQNLVALTAREHFFCHELLTKIWPSSQMNYALFAFISRPNADYKITLRTYERIKNNFKPSKNAIEKRKIKMIGAKWYTNGIKDTLTNNPPEGFYPGRTFKHSNNSIEKISKKLKGRTSNRKGTHLSNESKAIISKKLKGNKCANPESVRKRHLGMKRWTNGIENRVCLNCPGDGWYRGTTWHTKDTSKMSRKLK